jgi:hypothetical protein
VATTSVSTNASFFPLFVASSSNSNQAVDLGTGITFNPSTNTLSTTTFVGALTGNATNVTGIVAMANGGSAANLTASNGGIVYSTASAMAILAGVATAGKMLQSGLSAAPTWSTPTWPSASGTSRKIIISDGTNNVYSTETYATPGTTGNVMTSDGTNWTSAAPSAPSGSVTQFVSTQTGAAATGSTQIPFDDTIPQNTEGDQYMTLAITPKSASSTLMIYVIAQIVASTTVNCSMALFQDSTANALKAVSFATNGSNLVETILLHSMTSGTTSATTFKMRAGCNTGAVTFGFNGTSGGTRRFGGVAGSGMYIYEIAP